MKPIRLSEQRLPTLDHDEAMITIILLITKVDSNDPPFLLMALSTSENLRPVVRSAMLPLDIFVGEMAGTDSH
ncbi:hypothetical protein N9X99_02005 [Gammaproteobacteria bacterium]|nr:hypothetical protein [Gammaproteobacteria bacterium]